MRISSKLLLISSVFLLGCGNSSDHSANNELTYKDTAAKFQPIVTDFSNPVLLDSSQNVLFPLANPIDDDRMSFKSSEQVSYWNIAFYNSLSKKYHLLDNRKMIILQYEDQKELSSGPDVYLSEVHDPNPAQGLNIDGKLICYSVIIEDFNKDQKLTYADPKYLFTSDDAGNNFKQISPANLNVVSWQRVAKTNKLLIEVQSDSNNDKLFNNKDHIVPYVYDLKKGGPAEPVFSKEFNQAVDKLFKEQWPGAKK